MGLVQNLKKRFNNWVDRGFAELYSEENRDTIIGGSGQARNGAALPEANDAVKIRRLQLKTLAPFYERVSCFFDSF